MSDKTTFASVDVGLESLQPAISPDSSKSPRIDVLIVGEAAKRMLRKMEPNIVWRGRESRMKL